MTHNLSYPEKEKTKRKRGEYATDWSMVKHNLGIYTVIVWLSINVLSFSMSAINTDPFAFLYSIMMAFPTFFISILFSLLVLFINWCIHITSIRIFRGLGGLHNLIRQARNLWIFTTIALWFFALLSPSEMSEALFKDGLIYNLVWLAAFMYLLCAPIVAIATVKQVYGFGVIQAILSLAGGFSFLMSITCTLSLVAIALKWIWLINFL